MDFPASIVFCFHECGSRFHDDGQARFVIGAQQCRAVCRDYRLAEQRLELRILGNTDDLTCVPGQRDVTSLIIFDDLRFYIRAAGFGAPPHGGSAPGIDRIVMLIAGEPNLREVVLFPMNQKAEDLMMDAPCAVSPRQLRELSLRIVEPPKEG